MLRDGSSWTAIQDAFGCSRATIAKVAERAGIARRADELLDAAIYPASVASPKTGEEVNLSPAMTAISYKLAGHPMRESYSFTPSQDQGSWKLLALARASSRLSLVGGLVTESYAIALE
jgi:hypothetical protein